MKKNTKSQLKKSADAIFSRYIRKSRADWRGYGRCVTCGKIEPWEKQQNGHYISRGDHILRFAENNCHPQCIGCNMFKHGNYPKYSLYMVSKYGKGILEELDKQSKKTIQRTTKDYQDLIDKYTELFNSLS